jgi:hypothetical protein
MLRKATLIAATIFSLSFTCCVSSSQPQSADDWAMNNAQIGPNSPIEIAAGGSYDAQVVYPVPDGPLYPLKANVVWSIESPVKGITIDPKSGKITVAESVPHGTTTSVHADVARGKRKLESKLYVYSPKVNPLIGGWNIQSTTPCSGGNQPTEGKESANSGRDLLWRFHADNQFSIGRPFGLRAASLQQGTYEYESSARTLKLNPNWPRGSSESNWKVALEDNGKTVQLKAAKPQEGHGNVCGYTLGHGLKQTTTSQPHSGG